jgi:hypothetical protein
MIILYQGNKGAALAAAEFEQQQLAALQVSGVSAFIV